MTRFYLDTEFNGFGGELISLALVSPTGESWYEARETPNTVIDLWVFNHVMPVLHTTPMRDRLFKLAFQQFIQQFKEPEIICDWHADLGYFCDLLAGFNYGTSLDFAFSARVLKTSPGEPVSNLPHNALEDARALMRWHEAL